MNKIKGSIRISILITLLLVLAIFSIAYAGSVLDQGQLNGSPAQVNYLAWISFGGTPGEVLTEDGYNSLTGVNQGYQEGTWRLSQANFTNPPGFQGAPVFMLFGGLGADSGNIWTYNFTLDIAVSTTDHGTVGTQSTGTCPVMLQGSQDGAGKTINWSGTPSQYLIYRSTLPSGAGNGASNGRYSFVTSIASGIFTYLDTACPAGTDCWHIVVPANGSGVINGCHSEESTPTAITLSAFSASSHVASPWVLVLGVGLLVIIIAAGFSLRKRSKIAE